MPDPFHILNLERTYSIDLQMLETHYFNAQKKSHPDQFSQTTPQEKANALTKSTAVNQAYLILKNPLSRAEYLLKAAGHEPLSHDPTFLGLVMEWTDRLEQGEDLTPDLLERQNNLCLEMESSFGAKDYERVRLALYQLTYIEKLLKKSRGN